MRFIHGSRKSQRSLLFAAATSFVEFGDREPWVCGYPNNVSEVRAWSDAAEQSLASYNCDGILEALSLCINCRECRTLA